LAEGIATKAFSVGRSKECDVVIADPTVSRRHAEIVVHSATDFVLVDCESKFGTFLRHDDEWHPVSTTGVAIDDHIRLGQHETTVRTITAAVLEQLRTPSADHPIAAEPPAKPRPTRTIIERDPETGEIIIRDQQG
jgi:pSer/pThr/pTyr-binding forkhead associated (FHA) protein